MTSASASRVTRSSRSLRLAMVLFAGVLAAATVLRAQETPPAAPAPAPAPAPAASPPAAAGAEDESSGGAPGEPKAGEPTAVEAQDEGTTAGEQPAATNPPAPADRTRPVGPTPGRFEPTEKVRADFDVAFPIDI
jgi:hypothetical protein